MVEYPKLFAIEVGTFSLDTMRNPTDREKAEYFFEKVNTAKLEKNKSLLEKQITAHLGEFFREEPFYHLRCSCTESNSLEFSASFVAALPASLFSF